MAVFSHLVLSGLQEPESPKMLPLLGMNKLSASPSHLALTPASFALPDWFVLVSPILSLAFFLFLSLPSMKRRQD